MKGWCVRYGDALAWMEAPTAVPAVRRSLDLHPLGDWTDDAGQLAVFPQDACPDNAGRHDYTRAVLNARPPGPPVVPPDGAGGDPLSCSPEPRREFRRGRFLNHAGTHPGHG